VKKWAIAIVGVFVLSGCATAAPGSGNQTGEPAQAGQPAPAPAQTVEAPASASAAGDGLVTCTFAANGRQPARQVELPDGNDVPATGTSEVTMTLDKKPVVITLDRAKAPCAVRSFESLAAQGYFDGTSCHRLVAGNGLYILQCGDPSGTGTGGPGYFFADELEGVTGYPAGTVAMANSGADTNGSQFFLVYEDSQLPASYTVFGTMDPDGLEVVRAIALGGDDGTFGASGGGKPELPADITAVAVG
jgi:peptidyl-prolyl cis-trans isomerase B (cyclophilin B)